MSLGNAARGSHVIRVWQNKRGWYAACDNCGERSRACGDESGARAIGQMHVDGKLGVQGRRPAAQMSDIGNRRPGWFGPKSQMTHVLRTIGADADERGDFFVRGTIASFMGDPSPDADVVVGGDAEYRRSGLWCNLASVMNATSYGVRGITVI